MSLAVDHRVVVNPCDGERCYSNRVHGSNAIFHPGHHIACPRHVPNLENFCSGCGSPTNYREHASWCPRA